MPISRRFQLLEGRDVNRETFVEPWPEAGLIVADSPFDPSPSLRMEAGQVVELDGRPRAEFDILDTFIADHGLDLAAAETAMATPSLDLARMLVDIHVPRAEILRLAAGCTPAKLVEVIRHMNVLEMMMGLGKLRARRTPANQAHVTNRREHPALLAADAAEGVVHAGIAVDHRLGVAGQPVLHQLLRLLGAELVLLGDVQDRRLGNGLRLFEALVDAEEKSDVMIGSVYLGVTGGHITGFNNRGAVTIPEDRDEICEEDFEDVQASAREVSIPAPNMFVHSILQHYYVDGQDGVFSPDNRSWRVGVGLRWNLFDGLRREAAVARAARIFVILGTERVTERGLQIAACVINADVVSAKRGAAHVCSPLVTMALRASTQLASSPCDVSAAATIRLLRTLPSAAMASIQRGDTSCRTDSAATMRSSSSNS